MNIYLIIFSGIIFIFLIGFHIRNLIIIKSYESVILELHDTLIELKTINNSIITQFDIIDHNNSFKSDDEVGIIYNDIVSISSVITSAIDTITNNITIESNI